MKSWKTTVGGAIMAIGAAFSQSDDPTLKMIGQVLLILGPVIIGLFAKDSNVHGGTVAQATPPAVEAMAVKEGKALEK